MAEQFKVQMEFDAEAGPLLAELLKVLQVSGAAKVGLENAEKAGAALGTKVPTAGLSEGISRVKTNVDQLFLTINDKAGTAASKLNQAGGAASQMAAAAAPVAGHLNQAQSAAEGMTGSVIRGGLALGALERAARGLKDFLEKIGEAGLAQERIMRSLQFATGDGATEMAYVRRVASELGLELATTAKAYGEVAAASKGTRMEGAGVRQVFHAIASASTVLGLSADETNGALKAISQMMSKGTVAAEELRGQLGERLPGAFNLAAKAMGVSTQQLGKMLEQGEVIASEFLPRFAVELERSLGDAPAKAATSAQAQLNRIKTAWNDLLLSVGNAGPMQEAARAAGEIGDALQKAAGNGVARELGSGIASALVAAKDLVMFLWDMRGALLALAKAYLVVKGLQILDSIRAQVAAQLEAIAVTQAQQEATVMNALALAGHTKELGTNAAAQVAAARADIARRLAALEQAGVLTGLSAAEREATRASLLHAEAKLAEAAAITGAGNAARAASVATAALGGPVGVIIALIGAATFAWSMFGKASESASDQAAKALEKASQQRSKFNDLTQEVQRLEKVMSDSKAKVDEKKRAQEQLKTVLDQLIMVYPELNGFIKKEGETYTTALDALKKFTAAKKEDAEASLRQAQATLAAMKAEQTRLRQLAEAENKKAEDSSEEGAVEAWRRAQAALKQASASSSQIEAQEAIVTKGLEELQAWQKKLERMSAPAADQAPENNAKAAKDLVTHREHLVRLQQIEAQAASRSTLEEERKAKLLQAQAEVADKLTKLDDEKAKGKFARAGGEADYKAEKAALEDLLKAREGLINEEFDRKRTALEAKVQGELVAQEEGGLAKRLEAVRAHFARIKEQNQTLQKEGKAFLAEETILKAEQAAIDREYVERRKALETELQSALLGEEEGGLAKRLDQIQKQFAKLRQSNRELSANGQPFLTDEAILKAEDEAKARARIAQVREDLAKLKQELAELAQIKGRALTRQEEDEVTGRFKAKGGTKAEAAGQWDKEQHRGEKGSAGMKTAIDGYIAQSKSSFDAWKEFGTTAVQGLESSIGNFYASLTQKGQTWGQKAKALWMSVSGSAVQSLAKIAAQETTLWLIQKAKWAWEQLKSAWDTKETAKQEGEGAAKTVANSGSAASGFFASLASLPFGAGFAIAAALVVAMMKILGAITGRKVGGLAGKNGPELTMLGEEGLEVVAPEQDFKDWARSFTQQGAMMAMNIQGQQAEARGYQAKAYEYASQARQDPGSVRQVAQDAGMNLLVSMAGMVNMDGSNRGKRQVGRMVVDGIRARAREVGVVLRPGTVFAGI